MNGKRSISPRTGTPSDRRAFTLTELVVVLGVMAIMTGLLVPAVSNFGKATALTTAGSTVANLATFARQNSITKSTMTALLLLGDQRGSETDDAYPFYYRAFTLLEYDSDVGWRPIHKWETLPPGVIVDAADLDNCSFVDPAYSTQTFPFVSEEPRQSNPPATFHGVQIKPGRGFAARIFMPGGGLQNADSPAQIRLVEGVWQSGGLVRTRPGADGRSANYYDIAIIGATGMVKVSRP